MLDGDSCRNLLRRFARSSTHRICAPTGVQRRGIAGATKPVQEQRAALRLFRGLDAPVPVHCTGLQRWSRRWRHGNARSIPAVHEAARVLRSLSQCIRLVDCLDPFRLGIAVPDNATPRLDIELPVLQD